MIVTKAYIRVGRRGYGDPRRGDCWTVRVELSDGSVYTDSTSFPLSDDGRTAALDYADCIERAGR